MLKHEVANRVIAYRTDSGTTTCGLVIAAEGDVVRLFEYLPVSDPADHIASVESSLAEEDRFIASCEKKLAELQSKAAASRLGAGVSPDNKLKEKWLRWAKDGLRRIAAADFQRTTASRRRPSGTVVEVVCSAVAAIAKGAENPVDWGSVQEVFADPALVEKLCQLDAEPMPSSVHGMVMKHYFPNPLFVLQEATKHSQALGALHKWVTAYMEFQRQRLTGSEDLEFQQQREELLKGLTMAQQRRDRLQEDIDLSRRGMLFRRTNRIKVVPHGAIIKVIGDAPARLRREFVIKGLDDTAQEGGLVIVPQTPRENGVTARTNPPVSADASGAPPSHPERERPGKPFKGTAGGDCEKASPRQLEASGDAAASLAAADALTQRLLSSTHTSERVPSGLPTPRAPQVVQQARLTASQRHQALPAKTTATAPTSSSSTAKPAARRAVPAPAEPQPQPVAPVGATAPSSREAPTTPRNAAKVNEHHLVESAWRQHDLDAASVTHETSPDLSRAHLLSLQTELFRVQESNKGILDDYARLQSQYDAVMQVASELIQERARRERAWQEECAVIRREQVLAKSLVSILRGQVTQPEATVVSAPRILGHQGADTIQPAWEKKALPPSYKRGHVERLNASLQDALLCTSEYLRGAIATMEAPVSF